MPNESAIGRAFVIRFVIYLGLVALVFQVAVMATKQLGWHRVLQEGGLVENAQLVFLYATITGLLVLAIRRATARALYVVMICLAAMAVIRETIEAHWFVAGIKPWQSWSGVALILASVLFVFRRPLRAELPRFVARPAFIVFVLGAMLIAVWAQVLSRRELMTKQADRAVEELLELAGYVLICAGVVEELILRRDADSTSRAK